MRHEGWHRALDVQLDLHKWSLTEAGFTYHASVASNIMTNVKSGDHDEPPMDEREGFDVGLEIARRIPKALWQGDTMFVTSDMLHVLMQAAADMPDDVTVDIRQLLSPHGFILLEEPICGEDVNGIPFSVTSMLWTTELDTTRDTIVIGIMFFTDPYEDEGLGGVETLAETMRRNPLLTVPPQALGHIYPISDGRALPSWDGRPGARLVIECVRFFWSLMLVAHQPIGEPVRMRPNRAQRKRYEREYGDTAPQRMLTLITLRRKSAKNDDEPSKIEWSRRWVVRGHWRKQWYPKLKLHQYKYIYEYVKGPEDKPLITGRRVFNFRR